MKKRVHDGIDDTYSLSASKLPKLSDESATSISTPETPESRIAALRAKLEAVKKQKEDLYAISGMFKGD